MSLPTHLVAGLVIGKLTSNYFIALSVSCLVDLDHLISYFKNKILFDFKKLYKTITSEKDFYGDQRNFFHNIIFFFLFSFIFFLFLPKNISTFFIAYASHLLLDIFDKADYFPFYPYKKINWHGFITFFSWQEFILLIFLFIIFLII